MQFPFRNKKVINLTPKGIASSYHWENSITIGSGPNGAWTCGKHFSTPRGGLGSAISVWNGSFRNRNECLRYSLKELMEWHMKAAQNDEVHRNSSVYMSVTKKIIAQAQDILDTIKGKKMVQISLFNMQ